MPGFRTGALVGTAVAGAIGLVLAAGPAAAVPGPAFPVLLRTGQVSAQDVASQPGSEPDTLVEPDVAVSPRNPQIAVAVAHDSRFPDGGAVSISHAWTRDGGRHWQHAPMPGLTTATGGRYDRASDPVAAFGPDGSVYVSTLLFMATSCPSAVAVSRSTDGGATFGPPSFADQSDTCAFSDDKNWLVVDDQPRSPHRGRLYQFWTPFLSDDAGNPAGSPQVLRFSDDQGRHWGPLVDVSAPHANTQNSQPMIQPDGTLVDTYLQFGDDAAEEGPERPFDVAGRGADRAATPAAEEQGDLVAARVSRDGGATWGPEVSVTDQAGEGPAGIRCCLDSATADPVTGRLYVAWNGVELDQVQLASSRDGRHWSAPVTVTRDAATDPGPATVNVDVSAFAGRVFVSYGTLDATGTLVQQQLSTSFDLGRHFGPARAVGPVSDLRFAAQAGGIFPGDYIGSAATLGRLYLVWCVSSAPADPAARFHQVVFGAVLAT